MARKIDYVPTEREAELHKLTSTNFAHITNYTSYDVKKVLDSKIEAAGLIMVPVFAGISGLAKMLYGEKVRPMKRFCKFVDEYMDIAEPIARVLYKNVRDGLADCWMSKYYTALFAEYNRVDKGIVFYQSGKMLYINAVEFGYLYLAIVKKLQQMSDKGQLEFSEAVMKQEKNELSERDLDSASETGKESPLFGDMDEFKKKKFAA